jgi:hypothetical protein
MRTCDGKGGGGGGGDPDDVALGVQGHRAGRDRVANAAPHTQLPRSTVPAHHHATRVCRRTNKAHCQLKFEAGAGVDGGGGSGGRQQAATWACGILTTTQNSKKRVPGRFPPPTPPLTNPDTPRKTRTARVGGSLLSLESSLQNNKRGWQRARGRRPYPPHLAAIPCGPWRQRLRQSPCPWMGRWEAGGRHHWARPPPRSRAGGGPLRPQCLADHCSRGQTRM